jgi:hypothetical protein
VLVVPHIYALTQCAAKLLRILFDKINGRPESLLPLSAGSAPGASNTVALKRDGAPRSRPASTRPKHNHSAAAVLIFQDWYRTNELHPFPDAAAKAQMSADTGAAAVSVSVIRVCPPHA